MRLVRVFIASAVALAAMGVSQPQPPHWHSGSDHGRWADGQALAVADCQALFGGEGW